MVFIAASCANAGGPGSIPRSASPREVQLGNFP